VIKVHSVKCEKQEKTIAVLSAEKKEKRRKKKNTFSLWSAFVKKNPQSRKIKNYCLDLFCRLDENVNWIFFYAMKMCGFFNVRLPTVPTEKRTF